MSADGPYRGGAGGRFVCLACYQHLSSLAGVCPRCEVDLLSLDDPAVREDLRAETERRMQKRLYSEYFGLSILGFMLAVPFLPLVGELFYVLVGLGAAWACTKAFTAVRPASALALYAERRRRLGLELAGRPAPKALPPHETSPGGGDPADLDLDETLRWLGLSAPPER